MHCLSPGLRCLTKPVPSAYSLPLGEACPDPQIKMTLPALNAHEASGTTLTHESHSVLRHSQCPGAPSHLIKERVMAANETWQVAYQPLHLEKTPGSECSK